MKKLLVVLGCVFATVLILTSRTRANISLDKNENAEFEAFEIIPPETIRTEIVGIRPNTVVSKPPPKRKPETHNRYVTLACTPPGRLGNQMWMFFSGWAIGKTLGRKFYYNCGRPMMDDIEFMIWMFPKIAGELEIIRPKAEKAVQLLKSTAYNEYKDPIIYMNITDRYLKVDINYAQNPRFTLNYHDQIREILEFGANLTDTGETVIKDLRETRKINLDNVLCAHIRQTDFTSRGWGRSYEENLLAIRHVARLQQPRTLFIMGDDTKFMEKLVREMVGNGDIAEDSFHSTFKREVDMYLSKQLCKTFVITTERTTFGFWLAFLMGNDEEVYYLKEYREKVPRYDNDFPLPWHAIKVVNSTSILLN